MRQFGSQSINNKIYNKMFGSGNNSQHEIDMERKLKILDLKLEETKAIRKTKPKSQNGRK